ncbi:phosphorylase superfamily protein [Chlamydia ibidis]|uniref:Phosphorylase superfamily protein n=2 Tax=Chlamydia ibidis TaxID=1405396 RepID=S7KKU2_9CHLA|nr:phosphorylase superfamily protein [Chlamydia ibidis]EPP35065.1 phosphorylase superfamily protein [Chlamydia ibidis]EQM62607.1 phosphorylase superfamily protein [Chlamydia ibidis 10-1398/6]
MPPSLCKLLIIIADPIEARSLIPALGFRQISQFLYSCYDPVLQVTIDLLILYEWGGRSLIEKLGHLQDPYDYDLWINLGFAGACSDKIPLNCCYSIFSVTRLSNEPGHLTCDPPLPIPSVPSLPQAKLSSSETPYRYGLHDSLELVDMEGYIVATVCRHHNQRCVMIKVTSDYTTPNGVSYLKENMEKLAHTLTEAFVASLPEIICLAINDVSV